MLIFVTNDDTIASPCVQRLNRHATGIAMPRQFLSFKKLPKLLLTSGDSLLRRHPAEICAQTIKLGKSIETTDIWIAIWVYNFVKRIAVVFKPEGRSNTCST